MNRKIMSSFHCCKAVCRRHQSSLAPAYLKKESLSMDSTGIKTRPSSSHAFVNEVSYGGERRRVTNCYNKCLMNKSCLRNSFDFDRTMCTISKDERICWNCKKEIGSEIFFCKICKIIQPPLTELSLFEMFGSSETFDVDAKQLSDNYRKLQAILHPDKFGNSKDEEQQYSAEQSALINKAYNTVLDPLSRAVYLLELKNIHIGERNTIQDPEFLMEVMETNESLSEVKSKDDLETIRVKNNDHIDDCIEGISSSFSEGNYDRAKELVIKLRYYRNILEMVKEKTLEYE